MATKKKINVHKKIGLLAGLLLLALVGVVYVRNKPMEVAENNTAPTPTSSEAKPNIVIEDGVYTNYDYGFRFKYDNSVFATPVKFSEKLTQIFTMQGGDGTAEPYLSISLPEDDFSLITIRNKQFVSCSSLDINNRSKSRLLTSSTAIKILQSHSKCAFMHRPEGLEGGLWGFDGYFLLDKGILHISIDLDPNEDLNRYRPIFDEIFNSFETFKTE